MRANMPRFEKENFDKNLALVEQVKSLAAQKQCTPGQLALAWVLAQVSLRLISQASQSCSIFGHLRQHAPL